MVISTASLLALLLFVTLKLALHHFLKVNRAQLAMVTTDPICKSYPKRVF